VNAAAQCVFDMRGAYYPYYSGGSIKDISLYRSPYRVQSGRNVYYYSTGNGLGSVLKGVWNFLTPLIKSGSKAFGSELLQGSAEILDNIGGERSFQTLVDEQKKKRINNLRDRAMNKLTNLQSGSALRGIKSRGQLSDSLIKGIVLGRHGGGKKKSRKNRKKKIGKPKKKKSKGRRRKKSKKRQPDLFD